MKSILPGTSPFSSLRISSWFFCGCLSICLLGAGFTPAHAERKAVAFGLLGGLTGASLWGEDVNEIDIELRPTAGLTLTFHMPQFLGIEMDGFYFVKTGALASSVEGDTRVDRFTLHYLEFPLLLKITAPTESEAQPVFFVGASYARLVHKESTSEFIGGEGGIIAPTPIDPPLILEENLNDNQINFTLGGGLEWGLGTLQMRLSLARNSIDATEGVDIRHVLLGVLAGFIF